MADVKDIQDYLKDHGVQENFDVVSNSQKSATTGNVRDGIPTYSEWLKSQMEGSQRRKLNNNTVKNFMLDIFGLPRR